MSATLLYRIAAGVFVLFAVGHTYGFLSLRPASSEGRAVYDAMNTVHFEEGGQSLTYGAFYRGFGLSCTASMILIGISLLAPRRVGPLHSRRNWSSRLGLLCGAGRGRGAEFPVFWSVPNGSVRRSRCNRRSCRIPG